VFFENKNEIFFLEWIFVKGWREYQWDGREKLSKRDNGDKSLLTIKDQHVYVMEDGGDRC
jgi:hypothetical protein